jgi:starch synthase
MFATEMAPYIKTGGLADVIGSLPRALALNNHVDRIDVFIPFYRDIKRKNLTISELEFKFKIKIGSRNFNGSVYKLKTDHDKLNIYFIDNYHLFRIRSSLYVKDGRDYRDNLTRFVFFCRGSLETVKYLSSSQSYDTFHIHDWQTALISLYSKLDDYFRNSLPTTVFTIHNLAYQGLFPRSQFKLLEIAEKYNHHDFLESWGKLNLMKAGLLFSDLITTVSPTYAQEIQTKQYGAGLEELLKKLNEKLTGILNGVDYSVWNPETDPFIAQNYSLDNLSGKKVCKSRLQQTFQLEEDLAIPLLCVVSRLDWQKGLDLILNILPDLLQDNIQFVLLGTGDPKLENQFNEFGKQYSKETGISLTYNEHLAHQIEAGADIFLMPSRYEPCGLNDKYSLRYGTIPIVSKTGGLADSVVDYSKNSSRGTGFLFDVFTEDDFKDAIYRALKVFETKEKWVKLMQRGMQQDFSWYKAANAYLKLYKS